jgi:hypothetical protein
MKRKANGNERKYSSSLYATMMPCAERLIGWAAAVISYLSLVLRTGCGAAQQLRNLVPHRAVDNGGMLARVTTPL